MREKSTITRSVPTLANDLVGPDVDGFWKRLGRIERADLGWEDHGIFTVFLSFNFGGSVQGLPGGVLDTSIKDGNGYLEREGTAFGHDYIIGVMRAAGVERWSQLNGTVAYALYDTDAYGAPIVGIETDPTKKDRRRVIFEDLARKHGLQ